MALVLGLQHHDVRLRDQNFAQYWSELESVGVTLTQRSTMETLNRVRVDLKHRGIMPAQSEIESARLHVRDFFVENIPIMFSLNLEDASLVSIVQYDEARGHLEAAEAYARQQSYNDTITEIAYAFHALIEEYERRMSSVTIPLQCRVRLCLSVGPSWAPQRPKFRPSYRPSFYQLGRGPSTGRC